jgi:hypothetical protein
MYVCTHSRSRKGTENRLNQKRVSRSRALQVRKERKIVWLTWFHVRPCSRVSHSALTYVGNIPAVRFLPPCLCYLSVLLVGVRRHRHSLLAHAAQAPAPAPIPWRIRKQVYRYDTTARMFLKTQTQCTRTINTAAETLHRDDLNKNSVPRKQSRPILVPGANLAGQRGLLRKLRATPMLDFCRRCNFIGYPTKVIRVGGNLAK